jgi:TIR domain
LQCASMSCRPVLKRVQILDLLRIKYFQDFLTLNPGQRWQAALYREIDTCDLFLLFWSSAARDSEWVRKELLYALECRNKNLHGDPDILPVIIEGPPPIPPPPELEELHWNDMLIYLMRI